MNRRRAVSATAARAVAFFRSRSGGKTITEEGFETTFQVNHLSHLALLDGLLHRDHAPQRVVFVGSGTHDPKLRTGTPDPLDLDVAEMARDAADPEDDARTAGLRRYATSKLLNIATARGLARERPEMTTWAFDPGLMPATGLAREFPLGFRVAWKTVMRMLTVLPFASSARASGRALAALLGTDAPDPMSGSYVDYRLRPLTPSERAGDSEFQDHALATSRQLISAAHASSGRGSGSAKRKPTR